MSQLPSQNSSSPLVAGVGSALMDILLQESEEFLAQSGAQKGGMTLVDYTKIESVVSQSKQTPTQVPGGSACNTIIGLAKLGQNTRFIGRRGNDTLGEQLNTTLKQYNVEPVLEMSDTPTGRVLSIITPDAQRSMYTYLGAASETKPEEITVDKFKGAVLVHLEGYLLFNEQLIFTTLKAAKEAGSRVSLDLASYTVVESSKGILADIVKEYVDILLANEDEARVFTGCTDETEALEKLATYSDIAVLKIGKRGSYISQHGEIHAFGIMGTGEALDTTGAGDLWASGFLYGLVNNFPIEKCGNIAAACGYQVCQVIGAHIPEDGWERIKKFL